MAFSPLPAMSGELSIWLSLQAWAGYSYRSLYIRRALVAKMEGGRKGGRE